MAILPAHKAGGKLGIEGSLAFQSPRGNRHEIAVNRVTVRYVELAKFRLAEGVVSEVAERMLKQMKTSAALSFSLAMAKGQDPSQAAVKIRAGVRAYTRHMPPVWEKNAQSSKKAK